MRMRTFAALSMAVVMLAGSSAFAADTERVHKVVPLAPGGMVKIKNFSGKVTIVPTDRSEVVIEALRKAPQSRLDRIKLDVQASGSTVRIDANKKVDSSWTWPWRNNNVVETDMEIQVPRHTNLDVDVFSASVKVTGIEGDHKMKSFSGDLRMADVVGPVRGQTFSGNIDVQFASAGTKPDMDLHTFSGDIDVRVPSTAQASVDFNSFSGDFTTDLPMMLRTKSRRSVRADLNPSSQGSQWSRSSIYMKTFSGDARIHRN